MLYSHREKLESSRVCVEKLKKSELIAAQRSVVSLQQ